ncbi:nicotinate phosphoribosyltransferase [Diplodia corticola]|uniref:Nicotinate phosphoribosyltransferase n=1 Tax=Diplodia corticola TaxID=236234 RepID=A0A1J9RW85_9PEZI|nr:nicotinate phosphoribosyltransferase [Diplodia corticola]OJD36883.1 nicotinate phosphoribosyltransferase [Diplodia corticola]
MPLPGQEGFDSLDTSGHDNSTDKATTISEDGHVSDSSSERSTILLENPSKEDPGQTVAELMGQIRRLEVEDYANCNRARTMFDIQRKFLQIVLMHVDFFEPTMCRQMVPSLVKSLEHLFETLTMIRDGKPTNQSQKTWDKTTVTNLNWAMFCVRACLGFEQDMHICRRCAFLDRYIRECREELAPSRHDIEQWAFPINALPEGHPHATFKARVGDVHADAFLLSYLHHVAPLHEAAFKRIYGVTSAAAEIADEVSGMSHVLNLAATRRLNMEITHLDAYLRAVANRLSEAIRLYQELDYDEVTKTSKELSELSEHIEALLCFSIEPSEGGMATHDNDRALPEGVNSLLDTDLYKLTMQCCVLKYFPNVNVTYSFTNRTPHMRFTRAAHRWLQSQIDKLANITFSQPELDFLKNSCTYLNDQYLRFLSTFRLHPDVQIKLSFKADNDTGADEDVGDLDLRTEGLWVETILYEIPLLALISEAYFKFCDTDWTHDGQLDKAYRKGVELLENGCIFSEFGSRRRRDYHTHDLVMQGLMKAAKEADGNGWAGKVTGTSNVHFAMKYGVAPVGTVAHEWFMGVAAVTNNYEDANEIALSYWVSTFGEGVLGIALTDTFGTPDFLKAFKKPIPRYTSAEPGSAATAASVAASSTLPDTAALGNTEPPIRAPIRKGDSTNTGAPTFAQTFTGVRQDSGDPRGFIKMMRDFYDKEGIKDKKVIVFSDSLNIGLCLEYKRAAEAEGFQPTFGVGTFLTNDFVRASTGQKSVPLNIVIKIASAEGRAAVKISDNIGKNTGDKAMVADVKRRLGYVEKEWVGGDERTRWGTEGAASPKAA